MKKPVLIGTYFLGHENVRVFLRPETGGEFWFCPKDKGCATIYIGSAYDHWHNVVGVLMHEAVEFGFARIGTRFDASPSTTRSHASYVFMMTHEQMEVMASSVGPFLADVMPDLEKAWKASKKSPKK